MSYEYLPLLLLSLPVCYWLVQRVRARRRRSLAGKYGVMFHMSIRQPRPNYRIERM